MPKQEHSTRRCATQLRQNQNEPFQLRFDVISSVNVVAIISIVLFIINISASSPHDKRRDMPLFPLSLPLLYPHPYPYPEMMITFESTLASRSRVYCKLTTNTSLPNDRDTSNAIRKTSIPLPPNVIKQDADDITQTFTII